MLECVYHYISEEMFFIAGEGFMSEPYIIIIFIIGHIIELFIQ